MKANTISRKVGRRRWMAWIGSVLLVGIVCAAEPAPEVRLALVGDQACLPLVSKPEAGR